MNKGKKSMLQLDMALAGERIKILQGLKDTSDSATSGIRGDKTIQTSEFAYSDVLDTVKEKEVQPKDRPD